MAKAKATAPAAAAKPAGTPPIVAGGETKNAGTGAAVVKAVATGSGSAPVALASTPPTDEDKADKPSKAARLHITARTDGFRRCGRAWPAAGVTVPADEFSAEQLDALCAEPQLVVTEVGE